MVQNIYFVSEINILERKGAVRTTSKIASLNTFLDEHLYYGGVV